MGKQLKFGIIEDGGLKGKQIILEPRTGMKNNEWMIAEGTFAGGAPLFARYCLVCEVKIPDIGCFKCNKEVYQNASL